MKPNNLGKIIAEINGLITMTEMAMSANGDKTRLYNLKKEINRRLKLLNTRPKPSVKWPSRKDAIANGDGQGKTDEWSVGWNAAIDACQAAVDAAGMEYELDEGKLEEIIKNFQISANPVDEDFLEVEWREQLVRALKLAERELIVR